MSDDGVTERVDDVRDHPLQHLAQLEEGGGDAGADLQPLGGNLKDRGSFQLPLQDSGLVQLEKRYLLPIRIEC